MGVIVVQAIDTRALSLIIPLLLMAVALYVLVSPRMGDEDAHQRSAPAAMPRSGRQSAPMTAFSDPVPAASSPRRWWACAAFGLTRATALTKLFNLTSNIASVIFFAIGGKMFWLLGLCMAAGAMAGGWIGSHTAMRFGARLIRPLLVFCRSA